MAPGIPALCSWRSCIEAVIEAAEQLEVLHPGDVAEFRRKVTKDRDLLVVAHDLIRKMSPVSLARWHTGLGGGHGAEMAGLVWNRLSRVQASEQLLRAVMGVLCPLRAPVVLLQVGGQ